MAQPGVASPATKSKSAPLVQGGAEGEGEAVSEKLADGVAMIVALEETLVVTEPVGLAVTVGDKETDAVNVEETLPLAARLGEIELEGVVDALIETLGELDGTFHPLIHVAAGVQPDS